jgi:hypothetical protein
VGKFVQKFGRKTSEGERPIGRHRCRWELEEYGRRVWAGFISFRLGPVVVSSCGHSNKYAICLNLFMLKKKCLFSEAVAELIWIYWMVRIVRPLYIKKEFHTGA